MTVAFRYVLVLPVTKPPDAIMYKSNPHAVRVWHHCRAEIETTTQFYPRPQRGFNKLPEDAFYSLIQRMTLARLSGGMANTPGCISISRGRPALCCCRFQLNKCVCVSNTNPRRAAGKKKKKKKTKTATSEATSGRAGRKCSFLSSAETHMQGSCRDKYAQH